MPRRQSYSSYSSYLDKRVKDQCCNGGTGTATIENLASQSQFIDLQNLVNALELSLNNLDTGAIVISLSYFRTEISNIDASLTNIITNDISLIDVSLHYFRTILENLELSLNNIWLDSSFELLNAKMTEISSVAYSVSYDFYRLVNGESSGATISAESITVMGRLCIENDYKINLSGEEFDIREISSAAYEATRDISDLSGVVFDLSSVFYEFLDGTKQAQNISAVTIDVSNLNIGGSSFSISGHNLIIDGSLITLSGGTIVTGLTDISLDISFRNVDVSVNLWTNNLTVSSDVITINNVQYKLSDISSTAYGVSGDFYKLMSGELQAQNISAVTIDVSKLNIGGSTFSISGHNLIIDGSLITLSGGTIVTGLTDISLDISFRNVDISENLRVLNHAFIEDLSVNNNVNISGQLIVNNLTIENKVDNDISYTYIKSNNAFIVLDPAEHENYSASGGSSLGEVRIKGNLVVDGSTTTINSTNVYIRNEFSTLLVSGDVDISNDLYVGGVLSIEGTHTINLSGENFDIREISSAAYEATRDISDLSGVVFDLSSVFYEFLDGTKQAQNISAVTIDVSNLNIGGSSFSISGHNLIIDGSLITLSGGTIVTGLTDISLDISFRNVDISENLRVLNHAFIEDLSVNKLDISGVSFTDFYNRTQGLINHNITLGNDTPNIYELQNNNAKYNIAIGEGAMRFGHNDNRAHENNIAIGQNALYNPGSIMKNNIAIGKFALYGVDPAPTGEIEKNIAIGYEALRHTKASNSIVIGYESTVVVGGVSNDVFLHHENRNIKNVVAVGANIDFSGDITNSIVIGGNPDGKSTICDQSNVVMIGNENTKKWLPGKRGRLDWTNYWWDYWSTYIPNSNNILSNPVNSNGIYNTLTALLGSEFRNYISLTTDIYKRNEDTGIKFINKESEWVDVLDQSYISTSDINNFFFPFSYLKGHYGDISINTDLSYTYNLKKINELTINSINYTHPLHFTDFSNYYIFVHGNYRTNFINYNFQELFNSIPTLYNVYVKIDNPNQINYSTTIIDSVSYEMPISVSGAILYFPIDISINGLDNNSSDTSASRPYTFENDSSDMSSIYGLTRIKTQWYDITNTSEDYIGHTYNGSDIKAEDVFKGVQLGDLNNRFTSVYANRFVAGPATYTKQDENGIIRNLAINDLDGSDKLTIWQDILWKDIPQNIQRLAIQYGIPINIFSSAAGTWQAKSKFTQFGLEDLITYANRKNLLGTLNIRPDITFTFLNKSAIIDSYMATYQAGLLGPTLNVFINSIDFNYMDNIIDNKDISDVTHIDYIDPDDYNIDLNDISFTEVYKMGVPSMTRPSYFDVSNINDTSMVILDKVKLNKYKSIIYGGIEYEQIAIALEAIYQNRNDFEKSELSYLDSKRTVLFYYVDPNYHTYQDSSINGLFWDAMPAWIENDINGIPSVTNGTEKSSFDQCYNDLSNNGIELNNLIFNYKNSFSYSYGNIMFFRSHPRINKIFLPSYNNIYRQRQGIQQPDLRKTEVNFTVGLDFDHPENKFYKIYDSSYDSIKKDRGNHESENYLLDIVLVPLSPGTPSEKAVGRTGIAKANEFYNNDYSIDPCGNLGVNSIDEYIRSPSESTDHHDFLRIPTPKIYTILCGLNDNLTIEFFKYVNSQYNNSSPVTNNFAEDIFHRTYLCYYDGTSSSLVKSLTEGTGLSTTINNYIGLKKIVPAGNYNTSVLAYSSINTTNVMNFIDRIQNFVYNINEGKSLKIENIKHNTLSYLSGYIIAIDIIILMYLTQRFYSDLNNGISTYMGDFKRIISTQELFNTYKNILDNQWVDSSMESLYTDILYNSRYTSVSVKDNEIYDNSINQTFLSKDLNLKITDRFLINASKLVKRNINTWNQKSYYKILQLSPPTYITNNKISTSYTSEARIQDLTITETFWNDVTYKYYIKNDDNIDSFNNTTSNFTMTNYLNKYVGKIVKGLATGFKLEFKNQSLFPYYKSDTFGTSFKKYINNIVSTSSDNLTTGLITADILYNLSYNNYINSSTNYQNGYQLIIANYMNTVDYSTKPIDLLVQPLTLFIDGSYQNSVNIGDSCLNAIDVSTMPTTLMGPSGNLTSLNNVFTYYWDKFLDYGPAGETDSSNSLLNIMANDISNTLYYFINLAPSSITNWPTTQQTSFKNDNSNNFFFEYTKLDKINEILNTGTSINIKKIIKIILSFTLSRYQYLVLNSLMSNNPNYNDVKLYEYSDIFNNGQFVSQTMKYKVTYTFYDIYKIKSGFPIDQDIPYSIVEITDILKLYMKIFMSANSDLKTEFSNIDSLIATNYTQENVDEDFYRFLLDINNLYNLFDEQIGTTDISWSDTSDNIIGNINFWTNNSYTSLSDFLYLKDNLRVNLFNDWKTFTENRIITNI